MFRDLVLKNRSTRHFHQDKIERKTLLELIDLARISATATNKQPLKYVLSCEPEKNALIFSYISMAGAPQENQRPTAYIVVVADRNLRASAGLDPGIAAQTILLGATEMGLGGCMIGLVNRPELKQALHLPDNCDVSLVIAIGKPDETFTFESIGPGGDTQGYWDNKGTRHIPKRRLEDIIIG